MTVPEKDFWEKDNLIQIEAETANRLRQEAFSNVDVSAVVEAKNRRARDLQVLVQLHALHGGNRETWPGTPESRQLPRDFVHTSAPLPPKFRPYWVTEALTQHISR